MFFNSWDGGSESSVAELLSASSSDVHTFGSIMKCIQCCQDDFMAVTPDKHFWMGSGEEVRSNRSQGAACLGW